MKKKTAEETISKQNSFPMLKKKSKQIHSLRQEMISLKKEKSEYLESKYEEKESKITNRLKDLFRLRAAHYQSVNNAQKVKQIMDLYEHMRQKIHQVIHPQYVNHVLDTMFSTPIFRTTDLAKTTGIHKPTAMNLIQKLKQQDILQELVPGSGRRTAILCFRRLLFITR